MEQQRPIYCLICLFCLHCLDCLRCCKVCGHWTYPVRQSQEVLTNVKYDFWLNWLFLFSGLQRFEKKSLYLCLNRSLERIIFRRVTNLAFSRRPAWCPPSSLLVPGAALPNEFGKQRKQKNRTTCERWSLHQPYSVLLESQFSAPGNILKWWTDERIFKGCAKMNQKEILNDCLSVVANV